MDEKNKEMTETTKKPDMIDYYTFEGEQTRSERNVKRWMIACAVAFAAFVISNIGWLIYEAQYEDVVTTTQTVTQDTGSEGGTNTFTGDFYGGDYNGKTDDN